MITQKDIDNIELNLIEIDGTNSEELGNYYILIEKLSRIVNKEKEKTRNQFKVFLKERRWDRYVDIKSKVSFTLSKLKRESFDKTQLEFILTPAQLVQVTRVTTYEKLTVVTPQRRKELSKIVRKEKKL